MLQVIQLEEDKVSPAGEEDVQRVWVALVLEPGFGCSHPYLFVGIDIRMLVRLHKRGVGDEPGGVVRFGDGGVGNVGARERKNTVVGTDRHKHEEEVHTPFQRRREGMIGHKQKWERKTMVDRLYIGMENVGGKCRCKVGWKLVCECELSKGKSAGGEKAYLIVGDQLRLVVEDLDVDIGLIAAAVDSTLVDIALISIPQ